MDRYVNFFIRLWGCTTAILMSLLVTSAHTAPVEQIDLLQTPNWTEGAIQVIPNVTPSIDGGTSGILVLYPESIVSRTDDSILHSIALGPLETPYFSPSGRYFAIAEKVSPMDSRCELTLYASDGRSIWKTGDVPSGSIHISDDGKTVVGVNGYSILSREFSIIFYGSNGTPIRSLQDVKIEPENTGFSPDGSIFATIIRGEKSDGTVSLDDKLVTYSGRGEFLWEHVGYGLHFAGQLAVHNQRIFASFYADGGRRHYIHIYDVRGNQIAQVNPQIPNYGAYHLRISPAGDYLIGFGHHHIVLIETENGEIIWEWEWKDAGEEELIHNCFVTDDGNSTVAVAYSGRLGRIVRVFDNTGRLIRQSQYTVEYSKWGQIGLVPYGDEILLLDNGSGKNVRFSQ